MPQPTNSRPAARFGGLALAVVAIMLVAAGCGYCDPNNKPTTIPGQRNGYLTDSVLSTVTSQCRAFTAAGNDLRRMIADARAAGVTLTPAECYRDYAGQVYWRNYWCNLGECQMAAVPGTSNHGWGKAIDFDNLEFGTREYQWLANNAWFYNWNHPGWAARGTDSEEPWHWEWVGDGGTMFSGSANGAAVNGTTNAVETPAGVDR